MHHNIHIGSTIQSVFNQSGLTVSQFARLLEIQRTRIYTIFNSKTLDIDLLCKISDILHYDFISEYRDERQNPTVINIHFQITTEKLAEFIKMINRLKEAGIAT
jgi:transcriptional regulator with XRE-family HTH domain